MRGFLELIEHHLCDLGQVLKICSSIFPSVNWDNNGSNFIETLGGWKCLKQHLAQSKPGTGVSRYYDYNMSSHSS